MYAAIHPTILNLFDEQDFYTRKTAQTGYHSPVNTNGDIDFLLPKYTIKRKKNV